MTGEAEAKKPSTSAVVVWRRDNGAAGWTEPGTTLPAALCSVHGAMGIGISVHGQQWLSLACSPRQWLCPATSTATCPSSPTHNTIVCDAFSTAASESSTRNALVFLICADFSFILSAGPHGSFAPNLQRPGRAVHTAILYPIRAAVFTRKPLWAGPRVARAQIGGLAARPPITGPPTRRSLPDPCQSRWSARCWPALVC